MKKIQTIILISALLIGTQSIANMAIKSTMETTAIPETVRPAQSSEQEEKDTTDIEEIQSKITPEFVEELKACKPYDEESEIDIMGIKFAFKIKINGWADNKCNYKMSGKITGLSKEFRKSFDIKIADSEIAKFEPQIECGFTKEQLNVAIDAIIEEDQRNIAQINRILKNPEEAYNIPSTNDLTPQEKKLIDMIVEDNVCRVPNMDQLMQQFTDMSK
ncbi:hypothetical protein HDR58_03850 [bacterium]|nr:hypothetical protein [bacterium]